MRNELVFIVNPDEGVASRQLLIKFFLVGNHPYLSDLNYSLLAVGPTALERASPLVNQGRPWLNSQHGVFIPAIRKLGLFISCIAANVLAMEDARIKVLLRVCHIFNDSVTLFTRRLKDGKELHVFD